MKVDFTIGDSILGRYRILEKKGGGMGVVYLCRHEGTGALAALKTLKREWLPDEKRKNLFIGEMRTWIRLGRHPNIVQAYHIEEANGLPYVVMEMVPATRISKTVHIGTSIHDRVQIHNRSGGHFAFDLLVHYCLDICAGMVYAGERFGELGLQFVHLDIKPDNILVTPDDVAKVTDFGIASVTFDAPASGQTIEYASPEQLEGAACDIRSDVYSFGLTLYEMLTGRQYYQAMEDGTRVPKSSDWRSEAKKVVARAGMPMAGSLFSILERCIEEDRERRFSDFESIHAELSSLYRRLTGREHAQAKKREESLDQAINRGYSLNYLGLYDEVFPAFEQALEAERDLPQLWLNLGISQYGLGSVKDAEESFRHAVKLDPACGRAWFNLGVILHERDDTEDAEESYRLANIHDRGIKEAHLNLGLLHREAGETGEAIECFESALRLDPRWPPAWYELGRALQESGEERQAIQAFQITVIYDPEAVDAMMLLSRIYEGQGDGEQSAQWRERARAIDPDRP